MYIFHVFNFPVCGFSLKNQFDSFLLVRAETAKREPLSDLFPSHQCDIQTPQLIQPLQKTLISKTVIKSPTQAHRSLDNYKLQK